MSEQPSVCSAAPVTIWNPPREAPVSTRVLPAGSRIDAMARQMHDLRLVFAEPTEPDLGPEPEPELPAQPAAEPSGPPVEPPVREEYLQTRNCAPAEAPPGGDARGPSALRAGPSLGLLVVEGRSGREGSPVASPGLRLYPLDGDAALVGRAPACAVQFDEPSLSRKHCAFFRVAGAVVLQDLGSTNGTFVNGRRVDGMATLRGGDTVTVAGLQFRWVAPEQASRFDAASARAPDAA